MSFNKSILIIFCILLIDQFSKIYIKLHFPLTLYSSDALMDWGWFKILFVENKGMAWGAKISDFIPFISERVGKFILTSVRIMAVPLIFYWLNDSIKKRENKLLIISISSCKIAKENLEIYKENNGSKISKKQYAKELGKLKSNESENLELSSSTSTSLENFEIDKTSQN